MEDFLEKIISAIIAEPDQLEIQEGTEGEFSVYTIFVPEAEVGKIIGKGGRVINALRTLCRLKTMKTGEHVLIKVESKEAKG